VWRRNPREALAVPAAIVLGHVVEASGIKQEIERAADAEMIEPGDIPVHEIDRYAVTGGPTASLAQRAPDRIDTGRLPAVLREIDRITPHAATEVDRAPGPKGLRALDDIAQSLGWLQISEIPGRISEQIEELEQK